LKGNLYDFRLGDGIKGASALRDGEIDLLLTDPPYGISKSYTCEKQIPRRLRKDGRDFIMPKGNFGEWDKPVKPYEWLNAVLPKVGGWAVSFCAQAQSHRITPTKNKEPTRHGNRKAPPYPNLKEVAGNPNAPAPKPRKWNQPIETDWLVVNNDLDGFGSEQAIAFLHTVFCQTSLPYRNPGEDVRVWERRQGIIHLRIKAGEILHLDTEEWEPIGLPFGTKPRLILAYLSTQAIRAQRREIEVGKSLTGFVRKLGLTTKGHNIRIVKDQLTRLFAADLQLGRIQDDRVHLSKPRLIEGINLWFPKTDQQRVAWPTSVLLSPEYFESLLNHAVPLDEQALAKLSNNAMAFDVYTWLTQRLHRVPEHRQHLVPWVSLHNQFGHGYGRLRDFRGVFRATLKIVLEVYPTARIGENGQGLILYRSKPPVSTSATT